MEASQHTVAGYRDTFRLLLRFASARLGKPPVNLTVENIDANLVADLLLHGEMARGNTARSKRAASRVDHPAYLPEYQNPG